MADKPFDHYLMLKSQKISHTDKDDKELYQELCTMKRNNELLDFTIRVQGEEIRAHKLILAAKSSMLKAMLCGDMTEARSGEVSLDQFEPDIVRAVVDYMYTGDLLVEYDRVEDLVEIVDYLQMGTLKEKLEDQILHFVQINTCVDLSVLADKFSLAKLSIASEIMIADKFNIVSQQTEFKHLLYFNLVNLIKCNDLQPLKEDSLLNRCLEWIDHDKSRRMQQLSGLLENIDVHRYPPSDLTSILERFPWCSADLLANVSVPYLEKYSTLLRGQPAGSNPESHLLSLVNYDSLNGKERRDFTFEYLRNLASHTYQKEDIMIMFDANQFMFRRGHWTLQDYHNPLSGMMDTYQAPECACTTSKGFILIGLESDKNGDSFHDYDAIRDSWTTLAKLPHQLVGDMSAVYCRKKVYVVSVVAADDDEKIALSVYSFAAKQWDSNSYSQPQFDSHVNPQMVRVGYILYIIDALNTYTGGLGDENNVLHTYNIATNKWGTIKHPEHIVTDNASVVVVDDSIYVMGAHGRHCSRYRPDTNTWTVLAPCLQEHTDGAALRLCDSIVLLGGDDLNSVYNDDVMNFERSPSETVETYDIENDTWSVSEKHKLLKKLSNFAAIVCHM